MVIGFFAYRVLTFAGFREAVGGQSDRRRRGDVPARPARRCSATASSSSASPRRSSRNGCSASPTTPNVVMVLIVLFILVAGTFRGRLGAHHHADADLPAAGDASTASTRCISGWCSSSPPRSATTRRRSAAAMFVVCQVLRCPIRGVRRAESPALLRRRPVWSRYCSIFFPGVRAVRAQSDFRRVLTVDRAAWEAARWPAINSCGVDLLRFGPIVRPRAKSAWVIGALSLVLV